MPVLSYCKSVNNCSPNLLFFKVDRYEKLYFDPFFPCRAFWPCPAQLLIHIAQCPCPSCPALLFANTLLYFCSARFLSVPLLCPVLPCLTLPCPLLPCLQTPISGRSDRKVLRLIYIYVQYPIVFL